MTINVPLLLQPSLFYRACWRRVRNFRNNAGKFVRYQTTRRHFTQSNNL